MSPTAVAPEHQSDVAPDAGTDALGSAVSIGVDVGGTKIAAGLIDKGGRVLERRRTTTPAGDSAAIVRLIGELVEDLAAGDRVDTVGVAAPGFVDETRSTVRHAPNVAWTGLPLRRMLEDALCRKVVIENDANAAAWAEYRFGVAAGSRNVLMVTVGTGIGGGVVLNGRLVRGAFGAAAEIGHVRLHPGGHECGCGGRGCWEQYASGSALVRNTREAVSRGRRGAGLGWRAGADLSRLTGPIITAAALKGDHFATSQLAELGKQLGYGLTLVSAVLDPEMIVVGGGVAEAGDLLLTSTRQAFLEHRLAGSHLPSAAIVSASLGNDAGIIGAADLARQPDY